MSERQPASAAAPVPVDGIVTPTAAMNEYDVGPGRVVAGRYEILRPHRQGGLSVAFEATDLAAAGDAASCEVQLFPAALFDAEREVDDFAAAWQTWTRVRSRRVLAVRDIARVGPTALLLVTDLPRGRSLRSVLDESRRLPLVRAVAIALGVLEGLAAIHAVGQVHGDVKPSTVWLDEGDSPVLVDGGTTPGLWSAKGLGERTALIGTPYYAPIELFGGERPDVQSDVYSAATLLFEMLTGVQPWAGRTFLDVFQAKIAKEPPRFSERAPDVVIGPAVEAAVRGGLHADRAQRHASASEFARVLRAACA